MGAHKAPAIGPKNADEIVSPIVDTTPRMVIEMRLAMSAYSIAVAPTRSPKSVRKRGNIGAPPPQFDGAIISPIPVATSEIAYKTYRFDRQFSENCAHLRWRTPARRRRLCARGRDLRECAPSTPGAALRCGAAAAASRCGIARGCGR